MNILASDAIGNDLPDGQTLRDLLADCPFVGLERLPQD